MVMRTKSVIAKKKVKATATTQAMVTAARVVGN